MSKIAMIVNFDKPDALNTANELIKLLDNRADVYCLKDDASLLLGASPLSEEELFSLCPVVAVLGGDGTIIATAKKCAPYGSVLVGINIGNLGYLSTFESACLPEAAAILSSDNIPFDSHYMLAIRIYSSGKEVGVYHALNEVVISRGHSSHLVNFTAYSDDKTVCRYRADGMIIATPTGSTAYSLSAGGPILSPDADAMVITPICPHMLRARSIVLPTKLLKATADAPSQVAIDGQIHISLDNGDYITVEKSCYCARLVHNNELSFYDILQKKL